MYVLLVTLVLPIFFVILVTMNHRGLNLGALMLKRGSSFGGIALCLLWLTMHLIVTMWYFLLDLITSVESFLICRGLFKRYRDLDVSKVKYLAVVIDSDEAFQTRNVIVMLRWLAAMGVKNICLYDAKGVLKNSKDALQSWLKSEGLYDGKTNNTIDEQKMHLEFMSSSDGKLAIAKAANHLKKLYSDAHTKKTRKLTEPELTDALKTIGYEKPDPDLMLVYGPARCNMGFPAWRIQYTEIVHMGPLKSLKFGALIKAIHRFTSVRQNYGK